MADKVQKRYLVPEDYMADPSVHIFDGKLYIYPSHDWESGVPEDDFGSHFDMKDYLKVDSEEKKQYPNLDEAFKK